MVKKSKPTANVTVNAEVAALQRLSPRAFAWLMGISVRRLRNMPEIARNPDGTYDVRACLKWLVDQCEPTEVVLTMEEEDALCGAVLALNAKRRDAGESLESEASFTISRPNLDARLRKIDPQYARECPASGK